jgi:anti-sigma B factor antagonist
MKKRRNSFYPKKSCLFDDLTNPVITMNNSWTLSHHQNIQLLRVGDLLSEHINKEVLKKVDAQLKQGFADYVIDMGMVNYINSLGLNLLIIIKERAKRSGGKVVLAQASLTVVKLLEMTKLYALHELAETVEAAFDAFSTPEN